MGKGTWFPAIEAKGEGIFININSGYFNEWNETKGTGQIFQYKIIPKRYTWAFFYYYIPE